MDKKAIIFYLLLLATAARGEDPPPASPFPNLPTKPQANFNPFEVEDDFEEASDAAASAGDTAPTPARDTNRMGSKFDSPIVSGNSSDYRGAQASGAGGSSLGKGPVGKIVGGEPANAKDVVENFDYPDADILDVAKAIAKLSGKNFIYSAADVKGKKISIVSKTPITVGDAWNAFTTALNITGFALIPAGKYYRIDRVGTTKERQTPIVTKDYRVGSEEIVTRVVPLKYIDASEAEQAFRYWVPREARLQAYAQTNTLIITDTAAHIDYLLKLIQLLDVAGYQESIAVIPVRFATAKEVAALLEKIISEGRTASASSFGGAPRPAPTFPAGGAKPKGRSGGSVISQIIADDRTNSLILKANASGILEIRNLLRRLDVRAAPSEASGRIHVIQLQFASAEDIAKTLGTVTTGGAGGRGGAGGVRSSFPTFGDTSVFQGDIKVTADKPTQSLVIMASPQDFATVKKVVEKLDVPRDQVFIESIIMEMSVNRDNSFGTSFISGSSGIGLSSAQNSLGSILSGNPVTSGFVLGFKSGPAKAAQTIGTGDKAQTFHLNDLNGVIEMIQGNTDTNIIATPQLIALDNELATFQIDEGTYVPKSTTNQGATTQSFEPEKASVSLEVTPQINKASNFVKLKIKQKVEDFSDTNIPVNLIGQVKGKNARITDTQLIVQNEDTVVLSGMMQNKIQEIIRKVPILGDIPILGWLFKNSQKQVRKTNLLVFITPKIIKQYESMRTVVETRLKKRDAFVKEIYGTMDPQDKSIQELKESLPDLHVFQPLPQSKPMTSSSFPMPQSPERDSDGPDYSGLGGVGFPPNDFGAPPLEFNGQPPENSPPPAVEPLGTGEF